MLDILRMWYQRHFTDPQAVILLVLLVLGSLVILTMGTILAPVLAAIVIAFVLEWLVKLCTKMKVSRPLAVYVVFLLFCSLLVLFIFGLLPLVWQQIAGLVTDSPRIIASWNDSLQALPERYPDYFSASQINEFIQDLKMQSVKTGQTVLSVSLASIPALIALVVYCIIVPLMVFFFLKDRDKLHAWFVRFLPDERGLSSQVWNEVHDQLGNYILGKIAEVFIVAITTWILFAFLGLEYRLLLAIVVGLSVLVPYVGATVVTIPVAVVAFYQFGFDMHFWYVLIAYGILQMIDGNVLAPLLFSEAVDLHPVAIIIAIVLFGGLWGFWGVFFAIPLAILIRAVINAWP